MRTINCDRCGEEVGDDERRQLSLVFGDGDMECVADDLCPDCVTALHEWVKPRPQPAGQRSSGGGE